MKTSLTCMLLAALAIPFSLAACAAETNEQPSEEAAPEKTQETTEAIGKVGGGSFCLPGEKLVCTLGPPPVCHCEIIVVSPIPAPTIVRE